MSKLYFDEDGIDNHIRYIAIFVHTIILGSFVLRLAGVLEPSAWYRITLFVVTGAMFLWYGIALWNQRKEYVHFNNPHTPGASVGERENKAAGCFTTLSFLFGAFWIIFGIVTQQSIDTWTIWIPIVIHVLFFIHVIYDFKKTRAEYKKFKKNSR